MMGWEWGYQLCCSTMWCMCLATLCTPVVHHNPPHNIQYNCLHLYCTPHSRHIGTDTLHTYSHHNPIHCVDISTSPFPRRKVAQCNVFEAISLIDKHIDAGVVPCGVDCLCAYVCVLVGTLGSLCQHTGYCPQHCTFIQYVYRLLCVMRSWKVPVWAHQLWHNATLHLLCTHPHVPLTHWTIVQLIQVQTCGSDVPCCIASLAWQQGPWGSVPMEQGDQTEGNLSVETQHKHHSIINRVCTLNVMYNA